MMEFIYAHAWSLLAGITSLGIGSTVVIILLLGIPGAAVLSAIFGAISSAIGFFKTPLGQTIGIVSLILLGTIAGNVHGHREEMKIKDKEIASINAEWKKKINDAREQFETDRKRRDASVDASVNVLVSQRLADLATLSTTFQQQMVPHADDPKNCVLRPSDLDDGVRASAAAQPRPAKPRSTRK